MTSGESGREACESPRSECASAAPEPAGSASGGLPTTLARMLGADRVVLATLGIFAFLVMLAPGQAAESLRFTLWSLWGISGFLLASVLFAAYARASAADHLTAKVFAAGGVGVTVAAAATFGVLAPFCSCGVIPIVAALLVAGAPLSAVVAFWVSSPLMDPEMFLLTAGHLSPGFALARLGAAFGVALLAGYATWALQRRGFFASPLKKEPAGGARSVSAPEELRWSFWREPARRSLFARQFGQTGLFLLRWLALAFVLESLMVAYLPAGAVGSLLGAGHWYSVPLAVLAGVPAYLNGYAAIPTVAGLMELGMSGAAALAFVTAGGLTSVPAALAVYALVRGPVFAWYLALALAGSTIAGLAYAALTQLL